MISRTAIEILHKSFSMHLEFIKNRNFIIFYFIKI